MYADADDPIAMVQPVFVNQCQWWLTSIPVQQTRNLQGALHTAFWSKFAT